MVAIERYARDGGPVVGVVAGDPSDGADGTVAGAVGDDTGDAVDGDAVGEVTVALEKAGFAVCPVPGAHMAAVHGVFEEIAAALEFPEDFGGDKDAFDACMRELDETVGDTHGYALVVRDAEGLLAEEPDELEWFADAMEACAEHYGDADREFRVLLVVEPGRIDEEIERWEDSGGRPVTVG